MGIVSLYAPPLAGHIDSALRRGSIKPQENFLGIFYKHEVGEFHWQRLPFVLRGMLLFVFVIMYNHESPPTQTGKINSGPLQMSLMLDHWGKIP